MRTIGLTLTALVLAGPALAQQPGTAPPAANAATLDRYLMGWERSMESVTTLAARLKRTEKDTTLDSNRVLVGEAYYKKSGKGANAVNKAFLQMRLEGKQEVAEKYVCTGTYLYQFLPEEKKIKYFEVPRPKPGQGMEDNFLSFLFGMKADEAKKRYDLRLTKEDKFYVYVDVLPRTQADKEDFKQAQLVLNKDTLLPRRLWFVGSNKSETIWDIDPVEKNRDLADRMFDAPPTPTGWKLEPGKRPEAAAPPQIVPKNSR
jgi:TIGR03009 family protein